MSYREDTDNEPDADEREEMFRARKARNHQVECPGCGRWSSSLSSDPADDCGCWSCECGMVHKDGEECPREKEADANE